jgi:hypothetical protein
MKIRVNNEMVLLGVCAVVLLIASTSDWPYFVYVLLRVLICTVSAYLATKRYTEHNIPWTWAFAAVALLFNPVMPARMARSDWQVVNILCAVFFIVWLVYSKTDWIAIRLGLGSFTTQIRLAAERGDAKAQNNLGLLYDSGKGVQRTKAIQMHSSTLPLFTGMARVCRKTFPYLRFGIRKRRTKENRKLKSGLGPSTRMAEVCHRITHRLLLGTVKLLTMAMLLLRPDLECFTMAEEARHKTLLRRQAGTAKPQTRTMPRHRSDSEYCTAMAKACLRIMQRRQIGFVRRRSKVMEKLNSILAPYVVTGKECHGTAKKEMSGTAKLKSRATAMAQLESADSSSSGLACGRMAHGTYFANRPES